MRRWVLHIDMDAFFASCEQLTRPTLRGRPVLVGGRSGRGVIAGASYEARAYGAHSAMPMYRALNLVGYKAIAVPGRQVVYRMASARIFEVIERKAGVIEKLSIDEGFIEPEVLQGASAEEVRAWGEELRAEVFQETGLTASIGAGSGKQFAKIGSDEAKPDGMFVIEHEKELEWLHPLAVNKLWGVGPVTHTKLKAAGVETIGDLAALTRPEVEIILGNSVGLQLWQLAQGIDERPVEQRAEAKSVSAEHTYARDLTTKAQVDKAVERSAHDAHMRLLKDGRGARTVTVKLRMNDFRIESRSATLPYATDDAELLLALAGKLTRYPDEVGPIRLVGVGYSGLEADRQDVMFPELDLIAHTPVTADDDYEVGVAGQAIEAGFEITSEVEETHEGWQPGDDVYHEQYGHGWVQGAGAGVVSVRFETRATGPGPAKTFPLDTEELQPADPIDSLAWEDWIAQRESL